MNKEEAVQFLFNIAKEIKRSFESPVIFLTMKDYADSIFNSLMNMRSAMQQNAKPERVFEIVNAFHFEWLQAIQDIENFKKRVNDTPRESILKAIDYTLERVKKRRSFFKKYIHRLNDTMTASENQILQSDLGIMGDMEEILHSALIEKKRCLSLSADRVGFYLIVSDEIEELMNWLDRLNDYLAIQFSKVVGLKVPQLPTDLNKTLQQIIDEVADVSTPEAKQVIKDLNMKGKELGTKSRVVNSISDVEMSMIVEKIQNLEQRTSQLKNQKSSAVMALQHKTMYLQDRLQSLENLKVSLKLLRDQEHINRAQSDKDSVVNEDDIRIFNHLLPHQERCRLVELLVGLWEGAIIRENKSIISILSATNIQEVFNDSLGTFSIDKYGRKIYKKSDDNDLYQVNENNELVLLKDDERHVYFYDELGRYYLDSNRIRVYKAHAKASEYVLHKGGVMLKRTEVEDNVEYQFDHLGRYYIDETGRRIYRNRHSEDEYISDGLGNLERLNHNEQDYEYCPVEPMQAKESLYLKKVVGAALKTCLAEVVLTQPLDPIKYLADRLEKYYFSEKAKQRRLVEEKEMFAEREHCRLTKKHLTPSPSDGQAEDSVSDYNLINYKSQMF